MSCHTCICSCKVCAKVAALACSCFSSYVREIDALHLRGSHIVVLCRKCVFAASFHQFMLSTSKPGQLPHYGQSDCKVPSAAAAAPRAEADGVVVQVVVLVTVVATATASPHQQHQQHQAVVVVVFAFSHSAR